MGIDQLLVSLVAIWVGAKLLGQAAERLGQPAVLGELIAGVIVGGHCLRLVPGNDVIHLLAQLGVIILLFQIGLETDLGELLRVGPKSLVVALVGMAAPMAAGYGLALGVHMSVPAALMFGASLSATSIAITSRTLAELREAGSEEGRVILGAAVIDDVLGLVVLGIVVGVVRTGTAEAWPAVWAGAKAIGFLAGAIVVGHLLATPLLRLVDRMTVGGAVLTASLAVALVLAYLAGQAGSAPIIGAFAAGLVLARTHRVALIEERVEPIANILTPVFFVTMGAALDPSMLNPFGPHAATLGFALLVFAVAFAGKAVSGLAAWGKGTRRGLIGAGMVPRGEVGLVFADLGLQEGVFDKSAFAVLLVVVMLTTLAAPVVLGWLSRRRRRAEVGASEE